MNRAVAVIDIGKTTSKVTLWDESHTCLMRRTLANSSLATLPYRALDHQRIARFVEHSLAEMAQQSDLRAIIPLAHGAAAGLIGPQGLCAPVFDYETPVDGAIQADYRAQRDPFALTGSPALADGLNLGLQLHAIEQSRPELRDAPWQIVPWAQFWGWHLTGIAASEVTTLGAHTDLWQPHIARPSPLAERRGWATRLAPLARAGTPLGEVSLPGWQGRRPVVHTGLHDSNAALLMARSDARFSAGDATLLSTGTWFVAMRDVADGAMPQLHDGDATLFNVDVTGKPVPTAICMGGRELDLLSGDDPIVIDRADMQAALIEAFARQRDPGRAIAAAGGEDLSGTHIGQPRWLQRPDDALDRAALIVDFLAWRAAGILGKIGTTRLVLVDGRFGRCTLFLQRLAAHVPHVAVHRMEGAGDLALGALSTLAPAACAD